MAGAGIYTGGNPITESEMEISRSTRTVSGVLQWHLEHWLANLIHVSVAPRPTQFILFQEDKKKLEME